MHAFTAPGANMPDRGVQYNADAARRSGIAIENFFEEVFAEGQSLGSGEERRQDLERLRDARAVPGQELAVDQMYPPVAHCG
jgi:hypothetical protein